MNQDVRKNGYHDADKWLDHALAEYAQAEPRAGFEGRVLARVRCEQEQSRQKAGWRLALAFGAVAMLLLTLLWLGQPSAKRISGTQSSKVTPEASKSAQAFKQTQRIAGPNAPLNPPLRKPLKERVATPKRQQFPAALPLTDQERMLAQYVRDFPENAALMAQVQTDLQKLNELEMSGPRVEKESKNLDRKE